MLSIACQSNGSNRRISRRGLLFAGAAGLGGLTLSNLLRAEAFAGVSGSRKAVINIHLDGGPPQMDTIDPKPDAPAELRGEFEPIATKVPGLHITELMPKIASMADRVAFVRSIVGSDGRHDAFQCQSGYKTDSLKAIGGRPAMGCVVSRLLGKPTDPAPAFVDMMQGRPLARNSARPGFLGPAYGPFRPDLSAMFPRTLEDGMKIELAKLGDHHATSLELNAHLRGGRLDDRNSLLASLDTVRREIDNSNMMDAMDRYAQQAVGILTSGTFAAALDLSQEDPRIVEKYTPPNAGAKPPTYTSESPEAVRKFLLARRLVEAGVRCVSVSISDFDTHSNNFPRMRQMMPMVDFGLHALVTDLEQRGMLDDVSIIVWGEFGRTPKVNKNGGRDHWPAVSPAMLIGGGIRGGQVIGATDRTASAVTERPVEVRDIFCTLYRNLGIDARRTTIEDLQGRPRYLFDEGELIEELV